MISDVEHHHIPIGHLYVSHGEIASPLSIFFFLGLFAFLLLSCRNSLSFGYINSLQDI